MGRNKELFDEAKKYMPGGVNSPVRAFKAVGGVPKFISRAKGAYIYDEEGKEYIDYCCSWGPMILGHAQESIVSALKKSSEDGTSFGAPTKKEIDLAKMICGCVPSIEMVRMVSSGTEAVMSATRLARAYTQRDCIVKFNGCYHGHSDSFLVQAGSGLATFGEPSSPGVTKGTIKDTISCEFNDTASLKEIFRKRGKEIAAVIIEPVAGNMGVVLPVKGFLEKVREITKEYSSLLIFDEVITGFRIGKGGAQEHFNVMPDLTTLGKIIGGGLPVGAYGGSREIMSKVSPEGPVYQAGTLSGNPLAMSAGLAMLDYLINRDPYDKLSKMTGELSSGLNEIIKKGKYPVSTASIASMFCLFFRKEAPGSWGEAKDCDTEKYAKFFNSMLKSGIYIAPSQFETSFVSTAHSKADIEKTLIAYEKSLKEVFA